MRARALPFAVRRRSVRSNVGVVDVVVASLLLAVGLGAAAATSRDDSPAIAVTCCVVMAGGVVWRRRMPVPAACAALVGLVGYELVTRDPTLASPPVAVVLTFYALGRWDAAPIRAPRLVAMAGLGLVAMWTVAVDLKDSLAGAVSSWLAAVLAPLAIGILLAHRARLTRQLAVAAEQLRAEQDGNAARATAEERNRVARDLHDVVAHCVSVMVVQAGAARLVAARSAADADRALAVIGGCGRDAMVDLRRIVGVLRRTNDRDFGRGAGIGDLEALTERIRVAGVPATVHVDSTTPVPPAIDVVVYRVVQEALTNVVKHAGAGATADVAVHVEPDAVTVHVTNTSGTTTRTFVPSGNGLVGMTERVTTYGGEVRVGPEPDGGYAVRAHIPFHAPGSADADTALTSHRPPMPPSRWMSNGAVDVLFVALCLVVLETEVVLSPARRGPWLVNALAVAAMAVAAGWRRRYPLQFLGFVGGVAVALSGGLTALDRSTVTGLYCLAVPLFSVASWQPRTRAIAGLGFWAAGATTVAILHETGASGLAGALVMATIVWTAGRAWRAQRLLNRDLTETTARLSAERDQRAQLAVATERTRIARDLHGPVARDVVTMIVQAEAARKLLVHKPADLEDAIHDIERTGRDALSRLRSILGVLRAPASAPSRAEIGGSGETPTVSGPVERPTCIPEAELA